MDEVPDRAIIDLKAPLGKLGNQPTYCEVLLPDPLQKPLAMLTGNRFWLVATHLAGGNAAGLAHPPHPIDHRTDAQTKLRRRPVARQPTLLNRRDYTLTKIKRIWSAHRMLASNPASILNQNQPDLGIPVRFRLKSSRFSSDNHVIEMLGVMDSHDVCVWRPRSLLCEVKDRRTSRPFARFVRLFLRSIGPRVGRNSPNMSPATVPGMHRRGISSCVSSGAAMSAWHIEQIDAPRSA